MLPSDQAKDAKPVQVDEPAILIRINQTYRDGMSSQELYDATRGIWVARGTKRDNAEYAMAVYRGVIKEVYQVDGWHPAGTTSYHSRHFTDEEVQGRWEFIGRIAEQPLRAKYVGKSVASYFSRGAANPIKYVNCGP